MGADSWWRGGPIYQIYPRSFLDSDGDGIGDLEGVRRRLDYLADLGIRGIWLSPVYPSPMFDFGYDISCYHDIDPVFGDLQGFKRLVREAEDRGIGIIMDMVLNHSSHLHPWFQDAGKKDWYLWHPGRKGIGGRKKPPNNWMAAFGGRAWTYDERYGEYYLHLFTEEQPDLNWRNPQVKAAMFDELRFWLDLGVKGFRLDVINYLVKDELFRNNPYRLRLSYPRRHDLQHHAYDRNQAETFGIVRELRQLVDSYGDTLLVGEVYPDEGLHSPDLAAAFMGDGSDLLHLAFDFSPMYTEFTAAALRGILEAWYAKVPPGGWPCHVFSNHDQSRALSRLGLARKGDGPAKLLAALLLTQRGTPFLYYGEELGMADGRIRRSQLQDPLGKKYYPFHPGRDRSRTPMQWSAGPNAGFSSSSPWLPVNGDYPTRNAEAQAADAASVLSWYRALIRLRRDEAALVDGDLRFLEAGNPRVLCYSRSIPGRMLLGVFNVSGERASVLLPVPGRVLLSTHRTAGTSCGGKTNLGPYESTIFSLEQVAVAE